MTQGVGSRRRTRTGHRPYVSPRPWAYYNDSDPYVCQWTCNLIRAGFIPRGDVDCRPIQEVQPEDLLPYTQCHFFTGISGWAYALRLADWPDERKVWTGSVPCQPWSSAGKRQGRSDSRDLWPEFYRLISACRPPIVFGEQVASADVIGHVSSGSKRHSDGYIREPWLDRIFADLEASHYTCGAGDIPAAGIGAPHIRQRVWWVADSGPQRVRDEGRDQTHRTSSGVQGEDGKREWVRSDSWSGVGVSGRDGGLAYSRRALWGEIRATSGSDQSEEDVHDKRCGEDGGWMADCLLPRLEERQVQPPWSERTAFVGGGDAGGLGHSPQRGVGSLDGQPDSLNGRTSPSGRSDPWSASILLPCLDGRSRRVPNLISGIQPLAYAVPARISKLRAIGNAIVPGVAAEFIRAYMECRP